MEYRPLHLSSSSTNVCNKILNHLNRVFPTNKIESTRQAIRPKGLKSSLSCLNMFYSPIKPKEKILSSSMSSKDFSLSPKSNSNTSFKDLRLSYSNDRYSSPLKKVSIDSLTHQLKEERDKNIQYRQEIILLKQRIVELETNTRPILPSFHREKSLNDNNRNDYDDYNDIVKLKKEIESLKAFKKKVYGISQIYDDVNENIIKNLKRIEIAFNKLNEQRKSMSNDVKISTIEVGYVSFEKVVNIVIDMLKDKQDEYNYLLQQKDYEIDELKFNLRNNSNGNQGSYTRIRYWNKSNLGSDLLKHSSHTDRKKLYFK